MEGNPFDSSKFLMRPGDTIVLLPVRRRILPPERKGWYQTAREPSAGSRSGGEWFYTRQIEYFGGKEWSSIPDLSLPIAWGDAEFTIKTAYIFD